METLVLKVDPRRPDRGSIILAAGIIRRGGLVAFPTETVYGLGADALNPDAVKRIFKAKGRPQDNPMIVHVASLKDAKKLTRRFPPTAERLCRRFWPGPLTLILPKAKHVPYETTAGLSTVAIRMPDHPVALALLKESKTPIAAPSANTSGRPSPTSAEHVIADLDGRIDAVLDGGKSRIGVESTVLDLTSKTPTILRPGGVTAEELRRILGKVKVYEKKKGDKRPRSPGMKYRHYAPKAKVILVEGDAKKAKEAIARLALRYRSRGEKVAILKTKERTNAETAAGLYRRLREYDRQKADIIIAEATGEAGLGAAVMNRLRKAATKTVKA
jgi:L-threonylcarbamoyladenylate synthase